MYELDQQHAVSANIDWSLKLLNPSQHLCRNVFSKQGLMWCELTCGYCIRAATIGNGYDYLTFFMFGIERCLFGAAIAIRGFGLFDIGQSYFSNLNGTSVCSRCSHFFFRSWLMNGCVIKSQQFNLESSVHSLYECCLRGWVINFIFL